VKMKICYTFLLQGNWYIFQFCNEGGCSQRYCVHSHIVMHVAQRNLIQVWDEAFNTKTTILVLFLSRKTPSNTTLYQEWGPFIKLLLSLRFNLRERGHFEDPGVDGRIILRWIFRK
jgi:hypothetical protein